MIVTVTNDRSRDPVSISSPSKLSNGIAIPNDVYHIRLKEMLLANDDAYDAIDGPPGKTETPKVIHFRKFFKHLQLMGNFWDTSGDPSLAEADAVMQDPAAMNVGGKAEHPSPSRYADRLHKRLRLSDQRDTDMIRIISNSESIANNMSRKIDEPPATLPTLSQDSCSSNKWDRQQKQHVYTGRRTGTGSEMPESYRIDAVYFFLEPIIWEFGCRCIAPKILPRLQIQNLLIPVRPLSVVYRIPLLDRGRAILGELDGPIMGVQCRAEPPIPMPLDKEAALQEESRRSRSTSSTETEEKRNGIAAKDLLREVSAMLFLAQERNRAEKEEPIVGKGKWWAEKPRFGSKIAKDGGGSLNRKEKIEEELRQTKKELRRMSEVRDKKENCWRENQDGKSGGASSREHQDGKSEGSGSREHQDGQSGGAGSREHQDGKGGGSDDIERKDGGGENYDIAEKKGLGGTVREEGRGESRQRKERDVTRTTKTNAYPEKEMKKEWREKSEEENLKIEQTKEEKQESRGSARRKNGKGSGDREDKQGDHHTNEYEFERQASDEKPKGETPPTDPISRAKAKALRAWSKVQRPSSRWDKKITYLQMGKAPREEEDSARTSLSFVLLASSSLSLLSNLESIC